MQHKQILAFVPNGKKAYTSELYGYSSKSLPGLEIVGLGQKGRALKEKFYYINKKLNLKIPKRRFVLCVEDNIFHSSKDELYRWLELPLLIMYWSLAGIIPIQNLDNCLCGGMISSRIKLKVTPVEGLENEVLDGILEKDLRLISKSNYREFLGNNIIPVEDILREVIVKDTG